MVAPLARHSGSSSLTLSAHLLKRWLCLAGVLLALVCGGLPSQAQNNNGAGDGPGGGSGSPGPVFSDEAIGTLPTYWSDEEYPTFSGASGPEMNGLLKGQLFEAIVPATKVQALFVSATGQGYALIGPATPGMSRVRIYGNVHIGLDAKQLAKQNVTTKLRFGSDFVLGTAQLYKQGQAGQSIPLLAPGTSVDLGLKAVAQGKYGASLTQCRAAAPTGKLAIARTEMKNGVIRIHQGQN
jgi:hypothetical protein